LGISKGCCVSGIPKQYEKDHLENKRNYNIPDGKISPTTRINVVDSKIAIQPGISLSKKIGRVS
jgi:hypothetical protein